MGIANSLADLRARRQRRLDRDGSPNFRHTFGAIAATGMEYVEMQTDFPASRRYEPLTGLIITNNSAADLDLEINGRNYALVPAGVIMPISDQAIWSFRLTNNDTVTAAAGAVRANIQTPPLGADLAARRGL
tara:strand:+ start:125 stop:520 length:396 start_codon:yes stop_codon:yes gene_type:complete